MSKSWFSLGTAFGVGALQLRIVPLQGRSHRSVEQPDTDLLPGTVPRSLGFCGTRRVTDRFAEHDSCARLSWWQFSHASGDNMNDLEFAQRVSKRIGALYGEAKRSQHQFPKNALIQTRALASLCCDLISESYRDECPNGLDEKIRFLYRNRQINPETRELLDKLRRWGNAAAHPEVSLLDDAQFGSLANDALEHAIMLLEIVFRQQYGGAMLPDYVVVDARPDELPDACYRALVEASGPDQYRIAMLLRQRVATTVKEIEAGPDAFIESYTRRFEFDAVEGRALDLLRYASDASYAPACYQYGLALSEGRRGDKYVAFGVNLIAIAARDGDVDACAWCGHAAMHGLHDEPVDYVRARDYLEQAAADDHPLALSLLSRMYRNGLGVAPDARMAFDLTLRAAQAGYPVAQYEAGAALYQGQGIDIDKPAALVWLQRAAETGLSEAQQVLGNLVRCGTLPGGQAEAERLLKSAMRGVNEARLDLAELYMSRAEPRSWIDAAGLVQGAYETALAEQDAPLAERACSLAPVLVAKLEEMRTHMSDAEHADFVATRFMFDEKRQPYPDRGKRTREFADTVLALAKARASGSKEQWCLVRKLASGMEAGAAPAPTVRRVPPPAQVVRRITNAKVGRNELCPCGSGRKYKACCC